jgi:hypothetical protein
MMRRFHLFEIEDQAWCPQVLRDGITDFLAFSFRIAKQYHLAVPWLNRVLHLCRTHQVTDLCSGGTGPWPLILPIINRDRSPAVSVCLTDKYPNAIAFGRSLPEAQRVLTYSMISIDAADVPLQFDGVRTIFTSFHHFMPEQAKMVLRDAVKKKNGICIFEMTKRSPAAILMSVLSPFSVFLLTPLIRPFRLSRLLLTYALPIIPTAVLFDGIVSCLRTYTPGELNDLVDHPDFDSYEWHAGEEWNAFPVPMTYLVGYPTGLSGPED